MSIHPNRPAARSWLILTMIVTWFALILQQYILIDNTPGNGLTIPQAVARFFLYFTILSNLAVAISCTSILAAPKSGAGRFFSRSSSKAAIALYIIIVGLVYNLVLRSTWKPTGLQRLADELLHVAVPLLYTIWWVYFVPRTKLRWANLLSWLVFPLLYLIYALARGNAEDFYPYPFLDLNVLDANEVVVNCLLVMLAFVGVGALLIWFSRYRRRPGETLR